jgi:hypothetical protein
VELNAFNYERGRPEKCRRHRGIREVLTADFALRSSLVSLTNTTRQDLIRLSVGTEDIADILHDLSQALAAIPESALTTKDKNALSYQVNSEDTLACILDSGIDQEKKIVVNGIADGNDVVVTE